MTSAPVDAPNRPGEPGASAGIDRRPNDMVVHVAGEFDVATLPVLEQALARTYQAEENVYLDLSGVTFFDAASLGAVVGAHRLLAEDGRALVIVNPTRALTRLLRIADLDTLLLPAAS